MERFYANQLEKRLGKVNIGKEINKEKRRLGRQLTRSERQAVLQGVEAQKAEIIRENQETVAERLRVADELRPAAAADQAGAISRESARRGGNRRQQQLDEYISNASPRALDRALADGVGDVPQTEALYGRRLEGAPNRVVDQGISTMETLQGPAAARFNTTGQPGTSSQPPERTVNPINDAVNQRRRNRSMLLGGIAGGGLGIAGINSIREEQDRRSEEQELLASLGYR